MLHRLKVEAAYAKAILDKRKTFEIRYNDRGFNAGDFVDYTIVGSPSDYDLEYDSLPTYIIDYVHSGLGLQDGWVVLSIREYES